MLFPVAADGVPQMVANAGLFFSGPVVDVDVEKWDRLHSVNVRGVMLSVKHAARQMIAQGRGGVIIRTPDFLFRRCRLNRLSWGCYDSCCIGSWAKRCVVISLRGMRRDSDWPVRLWPHVYVLRLEIRSSGDHPICL